MVAKKPTAKYRRNKKIDRRRERECMGGVDDRGDLFGSLD
jgi:hypothetical protein